MVEIKFPVDDEEYREVLKKKGSKTHKKVYFDSLGIPYDPPKTGRPPTIDFTSHVKAGGKKPSLDEMEKSLQEKARDRALKEGRELLADSLEVMRKRKQSEG